MAYLVHTRKRMKNTRKRGRTKKRKQSKHTRRRRVKLRYRKTSRGGMRRNPKIGGKVFASGGFGCVFRPHLTCKGEQPVKDDTDISKLMTTKYAQEEYDNIITIQKALAHIPQYADYFVLADIRICAPAPLDESDKEGFKKCSNMKRRKITADNVNDHLDKLMILRMPDGGIPVDDMVKTNLNDATLLQTLNDTLIRLLKHGILPMNEAKIYHADIKDSNVLGQIHNGTVRTRLIDWGVSFRYNSSDIAERFVDSSLQYNVPYSSILFNDLLTRGYKNWALLPRDVQPSLSAFIANFAVAWVNGNGAGHLGLIDLYMKSMTPSNDPTTIISDVVMSQLDSEIQKSLKKYEAGYANIIEYLSAILRKYGSSNGDIDLLEYYNDVFIHNLDVWGFFTIYMGIAFHILDKIIHRTPHPAYTQFTNAVYSIMTEFMFKSPEKVISTQRLIKNLHTLTPILAQFP